MPIAPGMLPGLDRINRDFWQGGASSTLLIAHCPVCARYVHPPMPRCTRCDTPLRPAAVSGEGRVATFTVNHQRWLPGMATPFVFAAVELVEQSGLFVFSNIIGVPPETVVIGMPVRVKFQAVDDIHLPLFEPIR